MRMSGFSIGRPQPDSHPVSGGPTTLNRSCAAGPLPAVQSFRRELVGVPAHYFYVSGIQVSKLRVSATPRSDTLENPRGFRIDQKHAMVPGIHARLTAALNSSSE